VLIVKLKMKTNYVIDKHIEQLYKKGNTEFLLKNEYLIIKNKLKKNEFNIYKKYNDNEKIILYKKNIPEIILYEIICNNKLRHKDILGSLFSINLSINVYGDIIIDNGRCYIYVLPSISNYIKSNLTIIGNNNVELIERDINILNNYIRKLEDNEIIVSSLRIDTVISSITGLSRSNVIDKIKDKEILLNYNVLTNNSYILKEKDIFSVRKYGKYKYNGEVKKTKKNNLIISYSKYV